MIASQFEWNATYAGADGEFDTSDDFVSLNALHIPVAQPVVVQLMAQDVIHSFFLPEFRVKQDAGARPTSPRSGSRRHGPVSLPWPARSSAGSGTIGWGGRSSSIHRQISKIGSRSSKPKRRMTDEHDHCDGNARRTR